MAGTVTLGVAESVASRILYGLGRLRLFARLALADAALNLLLTLGLVRSWGVEGVAFAVAGPNLLFCLAVIGYTLRVLDVPVRSYFATWVRPLVAATVPTALWTLSPSTTTWGEIATGILDRIGAHGRRRLRDRRPVRPVVVSQTPSNSSFSTIGRCLEEYDRLMSKTGRLPVRGGFPDDRRL